MNKDNLSRRSFLKGSVAIGAGALTASIFGGVSVVKADEVKWDDEADVVIAGSGGGLVAACDAADAGSSVILLEKAGFLGGECIVNEGWINGAGTKIQAAEGVTDSAEIFAVDWSINHAANLAFETPEIVDTYIKNSGAAVDRLVELGCEYVLAQDTQFYGTAPRAHIIQPNASAWSKVLGKAAEDRGVKIMLNTPMTKIIMNEAGEAIGLEAGELKIKAKKGVILATGDMSANQRMKAKFQPQYAHVEGCIAANTGDGYFAALEVGADSSHTQNLGPGPSQMFYPTGSAINSYPLGKGIIMVNKDGKRFGNEFDYSGIATAQLEQPEGKCVGIFDARVAAMIHRPDCKVAEILPKFFAGECCALGLISGIGPAYFEDYVKNGTIVEAATLDELAEMVGVDAAGLKAQVETWNAAVAARADGEFGRPIFDNYQFGEPVGIEEGPFYGMLFGQPRWFCLDGPNLMVDTNMNILNVKGEPIARLYGAGAGLCGGTGTLYTNTCGDHMGFTAVSARIAAASASAQEPWEA